MPPLESSRKLSLEWDGVNLIIEFSLIGSQLIGYGMSGRHFGLLSSTRH